MNPALQFSIVVVVFNMAREAPRTLTSLTAGYQDMDAQTYEVIVVDNGSNPRLDQQKVASFGDNFRYRYVTDASPSPANAVNIGATLARAPNLGIMVDGARLLSPGVLKLAAHALRTPQSVLVTTLGFHLGPNSQQISVTQGYDQGAEDVLLTSIDWPRDGYRLFDISSLGLSSAGGWRGQITESNCLFLDRTMFDALGGYDERFDLPGGGLANLDFFCRASTASGNRELRLIGEGSFHQFHGGVSTGVSERATRRLWKRYTRQYRKIHGVPYCAPNNQIVPANRGRTNASR